MSTASVATTLRSAATVAMGRSARFAARLRGGGSGGTALPGLVMEKTDPGFLRRVLDQLPYGVVVVSGTNGKTTTTKMVVQLLEAQGLRVLTNRTGSNFVRGVLASLLHEVSWNGKVDADVAVLELDEAHAVKFVQSVRPRATLLLNVMRDQLDRFGEVDYTASLLHRVAEATSEVVVVNADDPRLTAPGFLAGLRARAACFGVDESLTDLFVSDDDLHDGRTPLPGQAQPTKVLREEAPHLPAPTVRLDSLRGDEVAMSVRGVRHEMTMTVPGIHNKLNAAAALALALELLGAEARVDALLSELRALQPAFGRGEVLSLDGRDVELALVKNPAGFRMSLLTAAGAQEVTGPETVMITINDEYADGRDMSWLWDVDFAALQEEGVAIVSGIRAWDMALRLRYDGVGVDTVKPDLGEAIEALREAAAAHPERRMRIFTTYTAMLELRQRLGALTDVEEVML